MEEEDQELLLSLDESLILSEELLPELAEEVEAPLEPSTSISPPLTTHLSAETLINHLSHLVINNQIEEAKRLYLANMRELSREELSNHYHDLMASRRALFPLPPKCMVVPDPLRALNPTQQVDFDYPPVFAINLKAREDRYGMITRRLKRHNFHYTMIEAEPMDSPVVHYLSWNAGTLNTNTSYNRMAEFACYTSHLKAMRALIDNGSPYGLIVEDDIAFRKGFKRDYLEVLGVMHALPKPPSLVLLMVSNLSFYQGKSKSEISLHPLNASCWGATAYLISRDYALKVLEDNDRPYYLVQKLPGYHRVTTEAYIMASDGMAVSKPLVIEDITSSNIGGGNIAHHLGLFTPMGYENFDMD